MIAPSGNVYQAGTLSGNPVAMVAGLTTLEKISQPGFYDEISYKTKRLVDGLNRVAKRHKFPFAAKAIGSMFGLFFTQTQDILSFDDVKTCDLEQFNRFFHYMLDHGVYFAPSVFEAGFMSIVHSEEDIDKTVGLFETFVIKNCVHSPG
jgi:glutamate-1-semialdehyde 2,1-aminomutase